ncbi:MAG: PA2779 family protein [Deltaproteobacteria bacterium]|nr:PA2779 family protein [Deltaproteobacteria bacterium]
MKLVKSWYFRQIALVLAFTMLAIGAIPAKSMAYVVGSEAVVAEHSREADLARIQRVLESKLVSDKLSESGLSQDEINGRLSQLSDEDVHSFASQLESVNPGGDGVGVVIGLLVIVILVIIILRLMDRKIIIR